MDTHITRALICLKDDFGIEYVVSKIEYKIWENEEFEYTFWPSYNVIDLIDTSLFQGIPGLDLSLRKESYVRHNVVPVFISERSPSKNREDLWDLLTECNMDYLNRLEWLIRTNTQYTGDRLYVTPFSDVDISKPILCTNESSKRAVYIYRHILDLICHGNSVNYLGLLIDDTNRKTCYDLLIRLYEKERSYLTSCQEAGIESAKKSGKYLGRKRTSINPLEFEKIYKAYLGKKLTAPAAAEKLGISVSTFFRRIKEL